MRNPLAEYREEVIEAIVELEHCSSKEAAKKADQHPESITHGARYRISPSLVAGSILGINDCCISNTPQKQ